MTLTHLDSPLGRLAILSEGGRLHALGFTEDHPRMATQLDSASPKPGSAPAITEALTAYFAGELHALDAIPVAELGTPFQRQVWAALRRIPPGQTRSYGQLASEIGRPRAVRAVGTANGANPIALVVPCHRVVGANGTLTGYAAGLPRKQWLLHHEGVVPLMFTSGAR